VGATRWDDLVERITRRQVSEKPTETRLFEVAPGHEADWEASLREQARQCVEAFRRARRA
jgi:hypothetical protein